ncbi:hypothetical protein [Oerskovia jenensis]|uniref:Uncharacterized protein n=1 Tax=Oerskovia jenensis TaxID=162169 RepID=A0ABS2LKR8_9CELL|nr:hypothetical protein [Oerskovia jenensis]
MSAVFAINFTDLHLALELGAPLHSLLRLQDLWWDPAAPYEAHGLRACCQYHTPRTSLQSRGPRPSGRGPQGR